MVKHLKKITHQPESSEAPSTSAAVETNRCLNEIEQRRSCMVQPKGETDEASHPLQCSRRLKGSDRTSERTSDKSSDKNASRASPIWSASTSGREWTGSGAPGGGIGGGLRLLLLGDDGDSWACVYAVLGFVTVASVAMIVAAVISPETVRKVFAFLLNMDSAVVVAAAARAADASNGERRDA